MEILSHGLQDTHTLSHTHPYGLMGCADFFARLLWGVRDLYFFACCHLFVWVVRKYIFCEIYDTAGKGESGGRCEVGKGKADPEKKKRKKYAICGRARKEKESGNNFFYAAAFCVLFCSVLVWSGLVFFLFFWRRRRTFGITL